MNKFINITTSALFLSLIIFVSCGGGSDEPDDPIDPCAINSELLVSGVATISKVTNPSGTIVTDDWTGFTLAFSGTKDGGSFTTNVSTLNDTSLDNIWSASGSWIFDSTDSNCKTLTINGGFAAGTRNVAISAITASGINLSFNVPETDTGRTQGIPGTWIFEFNY
jgi:hypothetical protein